MEQMKCFISLEFPTCGIDRMLFARILIAV